jgi:hypothetical protein
MPGVTKVSSRSLGDKALMGLIGIFAAVFLAFLVLLFFF